MFIGLTNVFDTLLPLFSGAHLNVEPSNAHIEAKNQPLQVHDQHFDDVHVDDVVDEERWEIVESKGMPKWLVQTLCDDNLIAPLPTHNHSWSHHASYAHDCYAFVVANMYNEEDPISLEEAQS